MCANPIQTNTAHVFQTMLRIVSLGFETSIKHLHHFLIGPNLVLMCHTLRIRGRSSSTIYYINDLVSTHINSSENDDPKF